MHKLRCIAVDDEPLALELLEDNIRQIPYLELVGGCHNAFEAMDLLHEQQADLIFLDIQMPGITGVQFLKSLQGQSASPMVIFITAYEQYALEGFELDVVDYLLKPVSFERFLKAANKAFELFKLRQQTPVPEILSTHFFVNANYALVKIRYDEITYIEGLKDYVKIFLTSARHPVITRMTLKGIEQKLPSHEFMRVHKSYIVSLDKIQSVRNLKIHIGEAIIPVGEQYVEEFMKSIGEN
ncbi:LytR/AlgR family response regulator transcription factor [Runella slithyformis]|uniref:Two component transcriptional regulator, LytTR family n=1 Tax=Runella slithyformis (strain ATCC 29530 / DSM 19594 / LMG 11500 / NCIMB 11436 / LSU 4) TaxID=761193 RepID=A0A7U3ZPG1_RUNSL|nr:LytTR family DNA-binding domain-containing protein [Runella slithyformis]AEI50956.1 two component transcriptional regulator, LytTR family [Runella slithyformis DSM 19594]